MSTFPRALFDPKTQPSRVRRIFRVWSAFYDHPFFQIGFYGRVHARIIRAAERYAPSPRSILDVGCGTGELLGKMSRRWSGARASGVDLSPAMLGQARRKRGALDPQRLVLGSVYALPFGEGAFDLVTNSISAHWYLDFPRALDEIARVCAPGGTLLMASMHNGPLGLVPNPWRGSVDSRNASYRSIDTHRRALTDAGFEVLAARRLVASPSALFVARR